MTESGVAYSNLSESEAAGTAVGTDIFRSLGERAPDVLVVFASSRYDYGVLLRAIERTSRAKILVGCSSAGEFTSAIQGEGSVSAVGLRSTEMQFSAALGTGLRADRLSAARQISSSFRASSSGNYLFRSALVLTDALAGRVDELMEELNVLTGGTYRFFGGGAGDDGRFSSTHVFCGAQAHTDAAVALEILSNKPLGIGVRHGWRPVSLPMRVTESEGMRLVSLNAIPAVEAFQEHAERTGQKLDLADPLPFFLHNVIGIRASAGAGYKLRVPLAVHEDGSISCAADIPAGSTVHIMGTSSASAAEAASAAIEAGLQQLEGHEPGVALFFDCVATRLRMGKEFGLEMRALQDALAPAKYAGCNTYGQIARLEGQFSGFHNCTATVCIVPK